MILTAIKFGQFQKVFLISIKVKEVIFKREMTKSSKKICIYREDSYSMADAALIEGERSLFFSRGFNRSRVCKET